MRFLTLVLAVSSSWAAPLQAADLPTGYGLIPGRVPLDWQGPDGNTIVIDAPKGLIVVDTGRSPMHVQKILDYATSRARPIAAIVNTHWHLDHTTGNDDLRSAFPAVKIYASDGIEGALVGFLNGPKPDLKALLADPATPDGQKKQLVRGRDRIDHPDKLRPTDVITQSGPMTIAGRTLDLHLARFAASEGDVWFFDPATKVAVVGDLVVDLVPFMDSACPEGWRRALGEIDAVPFTALVPGHGPVMSHQDFADWRGAFDRFVECGQSTVERSTCVDGWMKDADRFIDAEHRGWVRDAADYYLESRMRSSPAEQQKFCKTLKKG